MRGKKEISHQNPHQILNNQGQKLENKKKILREHARYYKELLKIRAAQNKEEEEIGRVVDKTFQEIIAEGKIVPEIITAIEIRKAIKGIKNKKAGNKNNWKPKLIKGGGSGMVQSLATHSAEQKKRIKFQYIRQKQELSQLTKEETKKG